MNFVKWFVYIVALIGFIWFVFFKPLHIGPSSSETKEALIDSPTTTDEYNIEPTFEDAETVIENIDTFTSEPSMVEEETIPEPEVTSNNTVPENITNSIDLSNTYLIVVGSFGVRKNAEKMLKRVHDSGKDGVITQIRGLYRVVTASTDSHSDAKNLRQHFTHIYKEEAFVLTQ